MFRESRSSTGADADETSPIVHQIPKSRKSLLQMRSRAKGDGQELFCHIRSLVDGEGSVLEGNKVTYVTQYNGRQGKYEAAEVRVAPGGEGDFRPDMSVPPPDVPVPEGGEGVMTFL